MMDNLSSIVGTPIFNKQKKENDCNGRIYRLKQTFFFNAKGHYVETIKLIPMKRLSCKGCDVCFWLDDAAEEELDCYKSGLSIDEIIDGHLYALTVTEESPDWETGIIEDYQLGFVRLTQQNPSKWEQTDVNK